MASETVQASTDDLAKSNENLPLDRPTKGLKKKKRKRKEEKKKKTNHNCQHH